MPNCRNMSRVPQPVMSDPLQLAYAWLIDEGYPLMQMCNLAWRLLRAQFWTHLSFVLELQRCCEGGEKATRALLLHFGLGCNTIYCQHDKTRRPANCSKALLNTDHHQALASKSILFLLDILAPVAIIELIGYWTFSWACRSGATHAEVMPLQACHISGPTVVQPWSHDCAENHNGNSQENAARCLWKCSAVLQDVLQIVDS